MSINWSVHLFIVHIKQHGCKHDSLGEAFFGLWSGCSPITTPKRLGRFATVLGGLDGHLDILLTQPRLSEVTSWSLPCMGELTFPSKVSLEEEFPLEKLGVIPWLIVVALIWVSVAQSLPFYAPYSLPWAMAFAKQQHLYFITVGMEFPPLCLTQRPIKRVIIPDDLINSFKSKRRLAWAARSQKSLILSIL